MDAFDEVDTALDNLKSREEVIRDYWARIEAARVAGISWQGIAERIGYKSGKYLNVSYLKYLNWESRSEDERGPLQMSILKQGS